MERITARPSGGGTRDDAVAVLSCNQRRGTTSPKAIHLVSPRPTCRQMISRVQSTGANNGAAGRARATSAETGCGRLVGARGQ